MATALGQVLVGLRMLHSNPHHPCDIGSVSNVKVLLLKLFEWLERCKALRNPSRGELTKLTEHMCSVKATICVPPLTSLIVNQKAKFVGEAQCDPQVVESICEGKAQLLFISPELLLSNPSWRDMLRTAVYQDNLSGFVVDEAHSC